MSKFAFDPDKVAEVGVWHSGNIFRALSIKFKDGTQYEIGTKEDHFHLHSVKVPESGRIVGISSLNSGNAYHFDL